MNKKQFLILAVIVLTSITVVGAYQSNKDQEYRDLREALREGTFTPEQVAGQGMIMTGDRIESAQSIKDLNDNSQIVISGAVLDAITSAGTNVGSLPIISTTYTIKIDEVLKGAYKSDTIEVWSYGGTWKGLECTVADDPNLVLGDEMIFFLVEKDNVFRTYGGPDGKYKIENGKVYHISEVTNESKYFDSNLALKGISYSSFVDQIN